MRDDGFGDLCDDVPEGYSDGQASRVTSSHARTGRSDN